MSLFASNEEIKELTGKTRYSAQADWLRRHGFTHIIRDDGSVALRRDEMDAHTLSATAKPKKKDWRSHLYGLDKVG